MSGKEIFERLAEEGPADPNKLLKEDDILSEEDKAKPDVKCEPTNGSTKPKKPCANCTCGLADELEKDASKAADSAKSTETSQGKSSCGSCYLGDAFRCASCPYKGMPAFKPGETVTLDVTSDDV